MLWDSACIVPIAFPSLVHFLFVLFFHYSLLLSFLCSCRNSIHAGGIQNLEVLYSSPDPNIQGGKSAYNPSYCIGRPARNNVIKQGDATLDESDLSWWQLQCEKFWEYLEPVRNQVSFVNIYTLASYDCYFPDSFCLNNVAFFFSYCLNYRRKFRDEYMIHHKQKIIYLIKRKYKFTYLNIFRIWWYVGQTQISANNALVLLILTILAQKLG